MQFSCGKLHDGHAVAQLGDVLFYKLEVREFVSHWCQRNFSLTKSFRSHCDAGIGSTYNRNVANKQCRLLQVLVAALLLGSCTNFGKRYPHPVDHRK
jgi:hypothetical protein